MSDDQTAPQTSDMFTVPNVADSATTQDRVSDEAADALRDALGFIGVGEAPSQAQRQAVLDGDDIADSDFMDDDFEEIPPSSPEVSADADADVADDQESGPTNAVGESEQEAQPDESDDLVEMMGGIEPAPRIPDPDLNEITPAEFALAGYRLGDLLKQRKADEAAQRLAQLQAEMGPDVADPSQYVSPKTADEQARFELARAKEEHRRNRLQESWQTNPVGTLVGSVAAAPLMALGALARGVKQGGDALGSQLHQYRYDRSMREFESAMSDVSMQAGGLQKTVNEIAHGVDDDIERKRLIEDYFRDAANAQQAEHLLNGFDKAARAAQVAMERGVRAGLSPDDATGGTLAVMSRFQRNNKGLLNDVGLNGRSLFEHMSQTIQGLFQAAKDLLQRLVGMEPDDGPRSSVSSGPRMAR